MIDHRAAAHNRMLDSPSSDKTNQVFWSVISEASPADVRQRIRLEASACSVGGLTISTDADCPTTTVEGINQLWANTSASGVNGGGVLSGNGVEVLLELAGEDDGSKFIAPGTVPGGVALPPVPASGVSPRGRKSWG